MSREEECLGEREICYKNLKSALLARIDVQWNKSSQIPEQTSCSKGRGSKEETSYFCNGGGRKGR